MKYLTILGSTGSIGVSTLDVVSRHPDSYKVHALTANKQVEKLALQCLKFSPKFAVVGSKEAAAELSSLISSHKTKVLWGEDALVEVVTDSQVDLVMAAIVGAAGLIPTLSAAKAGKTILLANKEALVMSGKLFMNEVLKNGSTLLPIDSEHNAIFQCLPRITQSKINEGGYLHSGVVELILTASGGPFRDSELSQLANVTPEQACAHPNWSMGRKISVDSATMMNKGLELIEAQWLFGLSPEKIQILIHPQSVIHSMVRYVDGSVLAQLGEPDMRTPIAYGLAWPNRLDGGVKPLRLEQMSGLTFSEPDLLKFPCLTLARESAKVGGSAPAVMNAANEIAVESFLSGKLSFLGIEQIVREVLNKTTIKDPDSIDEILEVDSMARDLTMQMITQGFGGMH